MTTKTYILTGRLDPESHRILTALRIEYFPEERNFLEAHVTLFHQAPEEIFTELTPDFPLEVKFTEAYFTGQGFAVHAQCPELLEWRKKILGAGYDLTRQDQEGKRLHVTIQNKVPGTKAKADFENFQKIWKPFQGLILGIDVWLYAGGPWVHQPMRSLSRKNPPEGPS